METSTSLVDGYGPVLHALDHIALGIFVAELLAKFYAYRGAFFRDSWNVFDLLVVGIAVLPAAGPFAVLRVLRLISVVPSMRKVNSRQLTAIPGMASFAALLALIIFVAGVMATKLF